MFSGVPSVPMITDVAVGIQLFTVTVRVFAGHTSLYFNVSVMNEQNNVVKLLDKQTGVPSGPMNHLIAVSFTQSGRNRFTVSASNRFGRSASESDLFPSANMLGLEGVHACYCENVNFGMCRFPTIVIVPSLIPSATSSSVAQPSSTITTESPSMNTMVALCSLQSPSFSYDLSLNWSCCWYYSWSDSSHLVIISVSRDFELLIMQEKR